MNTVTKKEKGFTIIEVVLVLAIAGLIFLTVFLALPALQRSQRDSQRKGDIGRLVSAIQTYKSNNNGRMPTLDATFATNYVGLDSAFKDPSTAVTYAFSVVATPTTTTPDAAATTIGTIYVGNSAKCGDGSGVNMVDASTGNRALVIKLESGGSFCQSI